jgi:hypothetical protein
MGNQVKSQISINQGKSLSINFIGRLSLSNRSNKLLTMLCWAHNQLVMHLRHTTGIDLASHLKTLDLFPSKSLHLDRKASDQHHRLGV